MSLNKNNAQKIIQEQNEKIARLEKAFRDVTVAYKTLINEKETLQATIKLLSNEKSTKSAAASNNSATGDKSNQDEEKISALKQNIQVLVDAKSKLEANFQLERKNLKAELDDFKHKYEKCKLENNQLKDDYESTMNELRLSLRQVQIEREKLVQENSIIMKELKRAKIDERLSEETNIKIDQSNLDNLQAEYKDLVEKLRNENNDLKIKIKNLNEKLNSPSDEVLKLEKEISRLKEHYEKRILEDSNRFMLAEMNFKENIEKTEKRAATLESEISELYKIVANYENKKKTVETRKSTSSTDHSIFMSLPNSFISSSNDDSQSQNQNDEVNKAIEKIYELKRFIEINAKDFKFEDFLSPLTRTRQNSVEKDDNLHDKCKEEYKLLRDEFDRYKARTNQLMKAKYNKELLTSTETNTQQQLKEEINYLKNRLNILEKSKLNDSIKYEDKIKTLESYIDNLKFEQKQELEKLEKNYTYNISDLEKQLSKQRERTFKLLNEKDIEIERYKSNYSNTPKKASLANSEADAVGAASSNFESEKENNEEEHQESKNESSSNTTPTKNSDDMNILKINSNLNETTLLHYSQEIAFKDAEISKLRKIKIDLEYRIKQILSENDSDLDNYKKQINLLKLEIERLKLNATRLEASANMEYIKNVVYRFLTTKDNNVKINMINAIAQILQFTKYEKSKAISFNA